MKVVACGATPYAGPGLEHGSKGLGFLVRFHDGMTWFLLEMDVELVLGLGMIGQASSREATVGPGCWKRQEPLPG